MSVARARLLSGARVLVVGASGGIGRPLSAAFAGRGAQLALAARDTSRLSDLGVAARSTFAFDLADEAAAQPLVAAAAETLGGLDGIVCCAGAVAFGPLDEIPSDVLHEIVAVDLVGPLLLARAAIPVLQRGGFVLNVSGVVAETPTAGIVVYSAAKAGISAGFRALAREVRSRGVSVIDARPPHTETGLAGRPLHGEPPRMREGLDPAAVAERLVLAVEQDERDVSASAFAHATGPWPR
jgi:cyclic-di-GMP-binding biofilm dispersal mediator protein